MEMAFNGFRSGYPNKQEKINEGETKEMDQYNLVKESNKSKGNS
jgi:hypothetical protein